MQFRMSVSNQDRDSQLYRLDENTLGLALRYKVALVRCEPTEMIVVPGLTDTFAFGDGVLFDEGDRYDLHRWEEWEWFAFTSNFAQVITDFWSEKFELVPNRPWISFAPNGPLTAQKVRCFLDIELVSLPPQAHLHYFIINKPRPIHPAGSFRSFALPNHRTGMFTDRDLGTKVFREPTRLRGHRNPLPVSYFQTTVAHEFGHSMLLDHVNGAHNGDAAYGITLEDRSNVMGMGSQLTRSLAPPWLSQLRRHLIRSQNDPAVRFRPRLLGDQSPGHMYIEVDPALQHLDKSRL